MNWLSFAAGFIVAAAVSFALHSLDVLHIDAINDAAQAAQKLALTKQCDDNKKISTEVSHDYEVGLSNLNNELSVWNNSLHDSANRVSVTGSWPRLDGATAAAGHGGGNEVDGEALADYAGRAEKYRLQLTACQDFINKIIAKPSK